jgi:hypothetical protein
LTKGYKIGLVSMMALLAVAVVAVLPLANAAPPTALNLGTAGNFAILSETGITDVSPSVITGNVGNSPGTGAQIGVSCAEVTGIIYAVDAAGPSCSVIDPSLLSTAVGNMQTAYTAGNAEATTVTNEGAGTLSGQTLAGGVYTFTGADVNVAITGSITLAGSSSSVWIFQIPGTLTVSGEVTVTLSGGASASNVFWVVGGVVAIQGPSTTFQGIILAGPSGSITMTNGATLIGRALSQTDVTLIMDKITAPSSQAVTPPPPPTRGCTVTYSIPGNVPPTSLVITSSGTYCFTSGETFNTQIQVLASYVTLTNTGGRQLATIQPAAVAATARDPDSGNLESAIILVIGATHASITNLVVDGSVASASIDNACNPPAYEGVLFLGASGSLTDSQVTNIYQATPGQYGCQSNVGDAVLVQTPPAGASVVSISNNVVTNYQKNGITCNDEGTNCSIDGNTVSPLAAATSTTGDATNGIQVAYGAVGMVSGNTVSGNECNVSACGPNLVTQTQSAGILTYESSAGTSVNGNTVSGNDIGIATVGDSAVSSNNQIQNNRYEGLLVNDGTYADSNNQLSCARHDSCLIGIAEVSDGYVDSPTNATLDGSNFSGTFSTALVQVVAYTGGNIGGTYSEPATLSINGLTETVTPGSCTPTGCTLTPSLVNITSIPGQGFGGFGQFGP